MAANDSSQHNEWSTLSSSKEGTAERASQYLQVSTARSNVEVGPCRAGADGPDIRRSLGTIKASSQSYMWGDAH